jgi:hypothetical protein
LAERELEIAAADGRFEDEGWRLRKDGSSFWANVVITAVRDESGNLKGFSKITRDLTERMQNEAQILASESRFRRSSRQPKTESSSSTSAQDKSRTPIRL